MILKQYTNILERFVVSIEKKRKRKISNKRLYIGQPERITCTNKCKGWRLINDYLSLSPRFFQNRAQWHGTAIIVIIWVTMYLPDPGLNQHKQHAREACYKPDHWRRSNPNVYTDSLHLNDDGLLTLAVSRFEVLSPFTWKLWEETRVPRGNQNQYQHITSNKLV